jgi:hypothetical protein
MQNAYCPPREPENRRSKIKPKPEQAIPMKIGRRPHPFSFLSFGLILASGIVHAEIQINASLDREQIAMNEQAVLSVVISGNSQKLPDPQMPGLTDFQISDAGRLQNFNWVNGQTTASITHRFVLTPKQVGRFTLPPIKVQADGNTLQTLPLDLEVVKGNAAAVPAAPADSPANAQGAPALFVQASVDKPSVFVDEPVTFSFRLYNRTAFLRQPQYQPPDTSGFWNEDLPPQRNFQASVKGVGYQVVEVRTALFPTHPGKATIGSAALNVAIQNLSGDANDIFANFFGGGQEKTLRTDPITIHVKALPTPEPPGFRGAVGQYSIDTSVDRRSTATGQPITLTITVSGRGNIKSLPDVPLPQMTHFRAFDANAATNIEKKDYRVQGSKVYKTVLIPIASGDLTIPSISFVYFDPSEQIYKTLKTKPLTIQVKPGPAGSTSPSVGATPGSQAAPGIKVLNEDIRYIKTPPSLATQGKPLHRRTSFQLMNALAFLFLIGSGLAAAYRKLFLSDPAQQRFRNARSKSNSWIQESDAALAGSDMGAASRALAQALQAFLAAKLNRREGGVALRPVVDELARRRLPAAQIDQVKSLWETLDLFQFAPAKVRPEELRVTRESVQTLLAQLDKEIKWVG